MRQLEIFGALFVNFGDFAVYNIKSSVLCGINGLKAIIPVAGFRRWDGLLDDSVAAMEYKRALQMFFSHEHGKPQRKFGSGRRFLRFLGKSNFSVRVGLQ